MISVTPISGMTLMTLIISAVSLSALGLRGESGMLAILLIGGVVCTALSMSGTLVTELKISYWLGATPHKVQWSNIFGALVAALVVTATMFLLGETAFGNLLGLGLFLGLCAYLYLDARRARREDAGPSLEM